MRRDWGWGELRERRCGLCGRTLYAAAGKGKEPMFNCGGCGVRWCGETMQTWKEGRDGEGRWTDVPEGKLAVFPTRGRLR